MISLLYPFMLLSALGFLLSAYAHVMALMHQPLIWGDSVWFLHIGIFVVWLPAVLVSQRIMRHGQQKDFWKIVLLGCPPWMRTAQHAIFGYAMLNFIYFIATAPRDPGTNDPTVIRGFSGHWLIFYGAAFTILYSARQRPDLLEGVKCDQGHSVDPLAEFCSACGTKIHHQHINA